VGRITLICTAYRESGKCNVQELAKILEAIGPEVIFEEIRPTDHESFYADESRHTVEMHAIREYLKGNKCRQVSVDDYEMPDDFGAYLHALDEFVGSNSIEYRETMDEMSRKKFELGFSYLNSSAFISGFKESERIYQETILKYGNDLAKSKLSQWNQQVRKRDSSMLENIYCFCQQSDFKEGVFLIGAGHMSSIMEEIDQRMKNPTNYVTWRYWGELNTFKANFLEE